MMAVLTVAYMEESMVERTERVEPYPVAMVADMAVERAVVGTVACSAAH